MAAGTFLSAAICLASVGGIFGVPVEFVVIPAMVVAGVGLYVLYRYLSRLTNFILEQNRTEVLSGIKMLIVRESADEASSLLGAVQLGTRVVSLLFSGVEAAADKVESWTQKTANNPLELKTILANIVLLLAAIGVVADSILNTFASVFHVTLTAIAITNILGSVAVVLLYRRKYAALLASLGFTALFGMALTVTSMFAFPAWLLLWLLAYPIREAILSAPFVDVSAEATPEGRWCVTHFLPNEEVLGGLSLFHSAAHDDSRVFELVAQWIEGEALRE